MNAQNLQAGAETLEIEKFDALAHEFWDPHGSFRPLHALNPVRLQYVEQRTPLSGREVLDVGCGGGLLAEAMARRGARVTGIDLAPAMIEVARLHAAASATPVDYLRCSAEELAAQGRRFDLITCMELIEHVPDAAGLVAALARLLRPGADLIVSTINRNLRAFLGAIAAAEYLLGLIPRGTHEYARLVRPAELAALARRAGLELKDLRGIAFNPLASTARLSHDIGINYLAHFRSEAPAA